jgi:hypothetical protein
VTQVRTAIPPWPIVVSLVVVVATRVVGTRLSYGLWVPWQESAMEGAMAATLLSFWLWPPRTREGRRAVRTGARLALQLGVVYVAFLPACVRAHDGEMYAAWFLLHRPLFSFLLVQPMARTFAELRLDPVRSVFETWATAALFLFWGLMIPAVLQGLAVDAPRALFWLRLAVPLAATLLMSVHLLCRSSVRTWWRELGSLVLRHWRLPLLFLLGELFTVLAGTLATLD